MIGARGGTRWTRAGAARSSRAVLTYAAAGLMITASTAHGQMMLPGALNGTPAGAPPKASGNSGSTEAPRAPPKPIIVKPPSEETIVGHVLARDGAMGSMTFDKAGNDLVLSKLALTGEKISMPTKACSFDVALAPPLVASPAGRPEGAIRYQVSLKACPFDIDVLDGAVLVSTAVPSCDFAAVDCRVVMAGLWGPAAADISDKRAKELERERVRIETTMRADFRVLLKRAGKDREAIKAIAREQAGFSSAREMTCRDYAQESVHGFCSTQITEARVLALLAKFGDDPEHVEERHRVPRPRPKPRLARTPGAATAAPAAAPDAQ